MSDTGDTDDRTGADTRVVQQAGQARFGALDVGVVAAGTHDGTGHARLDVTAPDRPSELVELSVGGDGLDLSGHGRLRLLAVADGGPGRRAEVTLELEPPA